MELNHEKCQCEWGKFGGRVCLVLTRVRRSRVRTAGRPTGSLRAAGGAPLHASPRPWCRPGRSLRPRPTLSRSCHGTQSGAKPHSDKPAAHHPKEKPARATRHSSLTQNARTHPYRAAHVFKRLVDSHRWVYAVVVRMIDRCWGGAVIHIGWVPTCWVWIGRSKPVRTHTHTQTHINPR